MDLRLFFSTFVAVFLAELGDKTQLATLSFATSGQSRLTVFAGSAAALVLSAGLAVLLGEGLAKVVSPRYLQRAAGVLFLVAGVWTLWASTRSAAA